jgi:ribosomal protein S18 acetylase RimI-like enzyme
MQAESVTIRHANVGDAELLQGLACRTFYDTFKGTAEEEDFEAAFAVWFAIPALRARISDPATTVFIAEDGDTPAGFMILRQHHPHFPSGAPEAGGLELQNFYLEKDYHSTGVAQRMMKLYFDLAKDLRLSYLWLGVWEHNYRAQRFYTKMGFSYTGYEHPFPIHNTPQTDQWWSMDLDLQS